MSEMVERVGKAFFAQFQKYGGLTTWENLSDDARRIWMTELIPSVIGAMREPTQDMLTAMGAVPELPIAGYFAKTYYAAIDEALK